MLRIAPSGVVTARTPFRHNEIPVVAAEFEIHRCCSSKKDVNLCCKTKLSQNRATVLRPKTDCRKAQGSSSKVRFNQESNCYPGTRVLYHYPGTVPFYLAGNAPFRVIIGRDL
eukprot:746336-Rhodomonas_salina.1